MVLQIFTAVKNGYQEVLEHREVARVEQANDLDEREKESFQAAVDHLTFVLLHIKCEFVASALLAWTALTQVVICSWTIAARSLGAHDTSLDCHYLVVILGGTEFGQELAALQKEVHFCLEFDFVVF